MDNIENNKLIAQFEGFDWENTFISDVNTDGEFIYNEERKCTPLDLKYDSDWNYLIPAIEKIENLKIEDQVQAGFVTIWSRKEGCTIEYKMYEDSDFYVSTKVTTTKIKAVYDTVVQFIKWYNIIKDKF
jgi:hypothetical protein